ncbi:hypothetical protein NP493_3539g00005 [Ridgeia piscesae]|uniref:Uncharacterized protein n=1 Tax=Ridgeia piscesae TaxID=27915 RepID=A0AAD9J5G5_RIDPI|nr:hypothetical protein NP493_3539g00005 [Ridgeia piscesae]
MVMYHGAVVDIHSVMTQLERSEKSRTAVEAKLKSIQQDMGDLRANFDTTETNSQKMAHELTELKRRLHEQQKSSEALQANSKCYYDLLSKSKVSLSSLVSDMTTALEEKPVKIVGGNESEH